MSILSTINVTGVLLADDGRVILHDAQLDSLQDELDAFIAAGGDPPDGEAVNAECNNHINCDGSFNGGCTNWGICNTSHDIGCD